MNLSLEGKNAIICGSSQGIGAAIAEELALMGANCILLARNEENLKTVIAKLDTSLRQMHYYHAFDFNDEAALRMQIQTIVSEAPVHILVNNSGGPAAGPIVQATEEQFLQAFQQHVITSHILVKAVLEGMKQEGFGRIINIISTSVKIPLANLGVSNTIRGAMASWAKTLANELGQFGITVNNVLPGFTTTSRLEALIQANAKKAGVSSEEIEKGMMDEVPAKRFGEPTEIAAMAAFLASPAAAYVNGTSIPVDGGRTGSI
ncbi:MAG TPA: SDR family oxidoreductase [Flavisolibacter sp.]|jgi:3-oxoacyl-[acyl-carrier protein] reductase|nr:SDR family oxidoreductase [Flavisolibacter sp.]